MGNLLTSLDLVLFFGSLLAVMLLGLWAGREEETSSDFFLAGKTARWWGVAGSIFGSNVSANHIVGMMGVGFSVGFAQSHFEISAIAGLLALCYGFLPVYRKLNVYTLSEYMSRRYDDRSRVAYAVIMLAVIVVIQMVPGFYIGSRSLNLLLQSGVTAAATAEIDPTTGSLTKINLAKAGQGYGSQPEILILSAQSEGFQPAKATAVLSEGSLTALEITEPGAGYSAENPPVIRISGGADFDAQLNPGDVRPSYYIWGILLMAVVTGTYTIFGGLKAVIVTDVLQSILMLVGGLIVAFLTFGQPEIGGWNGMLELDSKGRDMMHLYLPSSDPALPWSGVLSGLMVLHFYYWGTNQFIVQRALAARSGREARMGIVAAGFFKLLIPFMSIGTGIAAFYLFRERGVQVDQDAAFTMLLKDVVAPVGAGLVGMVSAGLIGAILSSLDSMLNSGATIATFDFYRRFVKPDATDRELIRVGRIFIGVFLIASALLCIFTMDPNSKDSFFLQIASHQSKLIAGVVVAFALGMFWSRATATGAIMAIISGAFFSYTLPWFYTRTIGQFPVVQELLGMELQFMHSVLIAAILAAILHVIVSLNGKRDREKGRLTWTDLGGHDPKRISLAGRNALLCLIAFGFLGIYVANRWMPPFPAACLGFLVAFAPFCYSALRAVEEARAGIRDTDEASTTLWKEDRLWAGVLAGCAVFMLFYYV